MPKKTPDDTKTVLVELNKVLHLHTSLWYVFIHGVVRGLGTAFGATVLVALVTSLAIQFADTAILGEIIKAITHSALE
ncbi:MAG: hypothetical protein RLZZ76_760 [Candidatus Parcubacteria bacterium]|jgi:hypothetical protein